MMFRDRTQAAGHLLEKLPKDLVDPLILAIPRSGFPLGEYLARKLGADFDLILTTHLSIPGYEFDWAGVVSEFGFVETEPFAGKKQLRPSELKRLSESQIEKLHALRSRLTPLRTMMNPKGRDVIVVDDGMVTGCTMAAALKSVDACCPRRTIAAVAVAPTQAQARVLKFANELVVLENVDDLQRVDSYFADGKANVSEEDIRSSLLALRKSKLPAQLSP